MDLEAGIQIGDFRIEKRIGNGATGIVYRARQVPLDRVVALKVLGKSLVDGRDIARFQREARAVARLNHPGIATVYYVGQDADTCYMAMELVEGASLDRLIQALAALDEPDMTIGLVLERLPLQEESAKALRFDLLGDYPDSELEVGTEKSSADVRSAHALQLLASQEYVRRSCEIICDASEALAHAHEQGVVHRDLKPANLIVDRECRGHLVDFGIARFFDDATVTRTGAVVGTPMYLAPELLTGRVHADQLSDIYSLGLVFYELLTLTRPIEATTREGILREIISKQLKPVSWLNPAVPPDLEGVVHKACAKDPDERYRSAGDFALDLKRFVAGRKVEAPAYRCKLDEREIAAERPKNILGVAFIFHFFAVISIACAGLATVWHPNAMPRTYIIIFSMLSVPLLAIGAWLYWIGSGLSSGRWLAWRAALFACLIVVVASVVYAYSQSFSFVGPGPLDKLFSAVTLLGLTLMLNAPTMVVAGVLLRRPTRDWFHFAEELRAERSRHLVRFSSRRPQSRGKSKKAQSLEK
jgi:serine/threonine protein kinase